MLCLPGTPSSRCFFLTYLPLPLRVQFRGHLLKPSLGLCPVLPESSAPLCLPRGIGGNSPSLRLGASSGQGIGTQFWKCCVVVGKTEPSQSLSIRLHDACLIVTRVPGAAAVEHRAVGRIGAVDLIWTHHGSPFLRKQYVFSGNRNCVAVFGENRVPGGGKCRIGGLQEGYLAPLLWFSCV